MTLINLKKYTSFLLWFLILYLDLTKIFNNNIHRDIMSLNSLMENKSMCIYICHTGNILILGEELKCVTERISLEQKCLIRLCMSKPPPILIPFSSNLFGGIKRLVAPYCLQYNA